MNGTILGIVFSSIACFNSCYGMAAVQPLPNNKEPMSAQADILLDLSNTAIRKQFIMSLFVGDGVEFNKRYFSNVCGGLENWFREYYGSTFDELYTLFEKIELESKLINKHYYDATKIAEIERMLRRAVLLFQKYLHSDHCFGSKPIVEGIPGFIYFHEEMFYSIELFIERYKLFFDYPLCAKKIMIVTNKRSPEIIKAFIVELQSVCVQGDHSKGLNFTISEKIIDDCMAKINRDYAGLEREIDMYNKTTSLQCPQKCKKSYFTGQSIGKFLLFSIVLGCIAKVLYDRRTHYKKRKLKQESEKEVFLVYRLLSEKPSFFECPTKFQIRNDLKK